MWAVVKKSVLGDLMKWFMQFDPKFLCVSCLKRARDRTCWVPVLLTKGWVPTGSLYGERTRQRKANQWHPSCCVRSFLSSYAHRVSIKKVWDTWHEIGSCGSYISSSFCYLSENDHTRSLFSYLYRRLYIPESHLFVKKLHKLLSSKPSSKRAEVSTEQLRLT